MSCPPLASCFVQLHSTAAVASGHTAPVREEPRLPALEPLTHGLLHTSSPRRDASEVEMPWIWQALRARVYSHMPTYEQSQDFKLVLAPVVVTSPSDTVPGIGIAGDF